MNRNSIIAMVSMVLGCLVAVQAQTIGDTMIVCTWAKNLPADQAYGFKYQCLLKALIQTSPVSYLDRYDVDARYEAGQWQRPQPPFPDSGMMVDFYFSTTVPPQIGYVSPSLHNVLWMTGIHATWDSIGTVDFFYPILPAGRPYAPGDSFVVNYGRNATGTFSYGTMPQYYATRPLFKGKVVQNGIDLTASFPMVMVIGPNPYRLMGVVAPAAVLRADSLGYFVGWRNLYGMELLAFAPLAKASHVRSAGGIHPSPVAGSSMPVFDLKGRRWKAGNSSGRVGAGITGGHSVVLTQHKRSPR